MCQGGMVNFLKKRFIVESQEHCVLLHGWIPTIVEIFGSNLVLYFIGEPVLMNLLLDGGVLENK